jgi:hypothetical protein
LPTHPLSNPSTGRLVSVNFYYFSVININPTLWQVRMPPPYPCKSLKMKERGPSAWGYNWVTLPLEDINRATWSFRLGVGCRADNFDP